MARDYSIRRRLLFAACGIAIMVVGAIRGKEALLWLLTLPLAALLVFLARMLSRMWPIPKNLADDTLSVPARSDRWIAAQAKVLAKRQPSSVFLTKFVPPAIICLFASILCLWSVLGHRGKADSVGAGDVTGILSGLIFLVMLLLLVALWRNLRASERHLAKIVLQRSSKAVGP